MFVKEVQKLAYRRKLNQTPKHKIWFYISTTPILEKYNRYKIGITSLSRQQVHKQESHKLPDSIIKLYIPLLDPRSYINDMKTKLYKYSVRNIITNQPTQHYTLEYESLRRIYLSCFKQNLKPLFEYIAYEDKSCENYDFNRFCIFYTEKKYGSTVPKKLCYNEVLRRLKSKKQNK